MVSQHKEEEFDSTALGCLPFATSCLFLEPISRALCQHLVSATRGGCELHQQPQNLPRQRTAAPAASFHPSLGCLAEGFQNPTDVACLWLRLSNTKRSSGADAMTQPKGLLLASGAHACPL